MQKLKKDIYQNISQTRMATAQCDTVTVELVHNNLHFTLKLLHQV